MAVFFIGQNENGQFGMGHCQNLKELTKCNHKCIKKVFASNGYSIFTDNDYENIWSAGWNEFGQCGVGNFDRKIKQYSQIRFFRKNRIKIKKISVNVCARFTFFISDKNKLFGCGWNEEGAMGLNEEEQSNVNEPILIDQLQNVMDVEPGESFNFVLSSNINDESLSVIGNWSRTHILPTDIVNIIVLFASKNSVYSTTNKLGSGHPQNKKLKDGWKQIEIFNDKHIVKVVMGEMYSLFLENTGIVWSCGYSGYGRLGLGENVEDDIFIPTPIKYFVDNNIMIKDIQCGACHNLALDVNGRVYCWGDNDCGQCGDGTTETVLTPKVMDCFKDYVVDTIRCGYTHCYIHTECDKHFMFGRNHYSECLAFNGQKEIKFPHRIDRILQTKYNIQSIIEVIPGYYNTTIICKLLL